MLSGKDKGQRAEVMRVIPQEERVIVEGVNVAKRHASRPGRRCRAASSTRTCRSGLGGGAGLHARDEPTRIGLPRSSDDGEKVRVCQKCGAEL